MIYKTDTAFLETDDIKSATIKMDNRLLNRCYVEVGCNNHSTIDIMVPCDDNDSYESATKMVDDIYKLKTSTDS